NSVDEKQRENFDSVFPQAGLFPEMTFNGEPNLRVEDRLSISPLRLADTDLEPICEANKDVGGVDFLDSVFRIFWAPRLLLKRVPQFDGNDRLLHDTRLH